MGITDFVRWETKASIKDPEGWWVIVYGEMDSRRQILVGIYAPHGKQWIFWAHLVEQIDVSWF